MTVDTKSLAVYVATACSDLGRVNAKVVFGLYWGANHPSTDVLHVSGYQSDSRGSIAALVRVFQVTEPAQSVHVYTTSQYAARAFAYGAAGHRERGWQCKNDAELVRFKLGVALLQERKR